MKNFLVFIIVILINSGIINATKWRVNSNPTVGAHFHTLKEAIAGAAAGDTLYMEASGAVYGDADTISKKLIIIGTGFFKGENYPTSTINSQASQLNKVVFEPGSEGTILMSMQLYSAVINADNITITKCYFYDGVDDDKTMLYVNGNNAIITKNYFNQINAQDWAADVSTELSVIAFYKSNALFSNNYIFKYISTQGNNYWNLLFCATNSTSTIVNNIFESSIGSALCAKFVIRNSYCANNIMYGSLNFNVISNNTFINNLSNAAIGTANGNIQNAVISTVFVSSGTSDSKFKLAVASPAKGVGVNGEDLGMFGGTDPYVISGLPTLPTIYQLTVPAQVSNQTGLKLTIKAKTSN